MIYDYFKYIIYDKQFQNNHNPCDGGHFPGEKVSPQQPFKTCDHGTI